MLKVLSFLIAVTFAQLSFAQDLEGKSARREPGVSYKAYQLRAKLFSKQLMPFSAEKTAVDSAEVFGKATLPKATAWDSEEVMLERFKSFRDQRFLKDSSSGLMRRSTWLYPDDGCFARAALAVRNLAQQKIAPPSKVFVFGDLNVSTKNAIGGQVSWWYHVAPLVEVNGQKYVLDPAIQPHHPLKLEDWLATMSNTPQNLEVAVCASGSYTPYDSCSTISDGREAIAERDQQGYLPIEWYRLEDLGREPAQELGDNPPWN
ncbi:MAG: hypothetical protein KF799_15545 [Bdellovibrionales bacterium]|nr:hypothetical protein [Bdellovibrionales bacterium]